MIDALGLDHALPQKANGMRGTSGAHSREIPGNVRVIPLRQVVPTRRAVVVRCAVRAAHIRPRELASEHTAQRQRLAISKPTKAQCMYVKRSGGAITQQLGRQLPQNW
jgi:hypothetical protein